MTDKLNPNMTALKQRGYALATHRGSYPGKPATGALRPRRCDLCGSTRSVQDAPHGGLLCKYHNDLRLADAITNLE